MFSSFRVGKRRKNPVLLLVLKTPLSVSRSDTSNPVDIWLFDSLSFFSIWTIFNKNTFTVERRNQDKCWFGFRHFRISDVRAFKISTLFGLVCYVLKWTMYNGSVHSIVWMSDIIFCPKSKRNCSDFSCSGLKNFNPVPFGLLGTETNFTLMVWFTQSYGFQTFGP